MTEKNITPAINIPNEIPQELSAEEFQNCLHKWFQDRGLLTELRAHLRKQMIGILNDSSLGHKVVSQQKQCVSPKLQVLNLLVGEFLLCHNYHYSLSVFSTEVPIASVLPEFPIVVQNTDQQVKKQWKFPEKDIWDLLETLGIRESHLANHICESYYKCNTEPLLTNIINCIKLTNTTPLSCENLFVCNSYEEWIKSIGELLRFNNISNANIKDILNTIMNLVETERKCIRKEVADEFLMNQAKLKEEFSIQQEEQAKKWSLLTNSLEMEKSKLINEKAQKQMEVEQFKQKILKHHTMLQDRYNILIAREKEVHKKKFHLLQKEECLETQQQHLQIGFDSLHQEQKVVAELEQKLQQELNEQRAKFNSAFFENIQKVMDNNKSSTVVPVSTEENDGKNQKENSLEKLIHQLQIEKTALQNVNLEQRTRIDELTERCSLMMRDLESTQAAVNILSSNNNIFHGMLTAPPLMPPMSTFNGRGRLVRNGGGEDGSRAISPSLREYKNIHNLREIRLPSRGINGYSSSTSDDGTNSQMLQEARDKLRKLEEESEEVDKHYQKFKLNSYSLDYKESPCGNDFHQEKDEDVNFNLKYLKDLQKPGTSASSLMEYIPNETQLTTVTKDALDFKLNKDGRSNVKAGKNIVGNTMHKGDEVSSFSSSFDLDTSGVSLSNAGSSEEKTY